MLGYKFTLQLLGSGGPITDDARASAGEVIWLDGKSKILIDAGGGTYLRFGQLGARLEDLKIINMTHFHVDHSADLPAILKGAYFSDIKTSLPFLVQFMEDFSQVLQNFLTGCLRKIQVLLHTYMGYLQEQMIFSNRSCY